MIVKYFTDYIKDYSIGDLVKLHKAVEMMRVDGRDGANVKHFEFMGIITKIKDYDNYKAIHIELLEDIKDKALIGCLNTPFWIDCLEKINEY